MNFRHTLLAIFICFIWGFSFVVGKYAVSYYPSFFMLGLRLVMVSVILLPFIMKKPEIPIKKLLPISFTLTVLHFGLLFAGLGQGIDSVVAVVIDQMRVPFAAILSYFIFGEKFGKRSLAGLALAIIGTFVITGAPHIINNYMAFWLILASSFGWAVYNMQLHDIKLDMNVFSFIGWVSLLGAPQMFIISALIEHNQIDILLNSSVLNVMSLLYITILNTMVAHASWYYLLRKYDVNRVVPYSLLIPVFGILCGTVVLGEKMTPLIIIGSAITIVGVAIIVMRKPKTAELGENT